MIRKHGFTVIELTLVMALVGVVMGIVIVRLDMGSPRQRMIQESRRLGNLICSYRERAMAEQRLYALTLDASSSQWTLSSPSETSAAAVETALPLLKRTIPSPVKCLSVTGLDAVELATPVTLFFSARGTTPPSAIDIGIDKRNFITVQIDPIVNEVTYVEHH